MIHVVVLIRVLARVIELVCPALGVYIVICHAGIWGGALSCNEEPQAEYGTRSSRTRTH